MKDPNGNDWASIYRDTPGYDFAGSFGSSHLAGCNMAWCDGSVCMVSYSIDVLTHIHMTNRCDGQRLTPEGGSKRARSVPVPDVLAARNRPARIAPSESRRARSALRRRSEPLQSQLLGSLKVALQSSRRCPPEGDFWRSAYI